MATVQEWSGREARALRQALRMSVRGFAAYLGAGDRTITKWEARGATVCPRTDMQAALDTALARADVDARARFEVALTEASLRDTVAIGTRPLPRRRPAALEGAGEVPEDQEVRRRRLLELAVLGIAGGGPAVKLEALRHDLIQAVASDAAASLDEWEAVAWEYGCTYAVTPPPALLGDLGVDLLVARDQLDRLTDEPSRRAMQRAIALLAAFLAQTLGNLGNVRAGRRWWRTARATADRSRDPEVQTWVRGREVIRGIHEGWPLTAVLELADEAVALDATPGMGTGSVLIGRAQVLAAMGQSTQARAAMADVYDVVDHLPARVTNDSTSMYGWPEYRLRHGESFVYTYLGDNHRAATTQERALTLYPAHMFRERAQVQLHQAMRMVRSGDTTAGADHARRVVGELPQTQRIEVVLEVARTVAQAVPTTEQHQPEVVALRELLALPAVSGGR